jgi:ergothioneine biosynthesis protein EgtB
VNRSLDRLTRLSEPAPFEREALAVQYRRVRDLTRQLSAPLSAEDQGVQSMPDASPTKWHLAHTSWFFEALLLQRHQPGYRPHDEAYLYLYNSYYEALGPRHPRPQRGLLSRPSLAEVWHYREHIDAAVLRWLAEASDAQLAAAAPVFTLGLHHEQQHQELLLTDIKHAFSLNPLAPVYVPRPTYRHRDHEASAPPGWQRCSGGIVQIGHADTGFAFDNESPRHAVLLAPYQLATRPASCADYLAFMQDGAYQQPQWWLSDGWALRQAEHWDAPAYWRNPAPLGSAAYADPGAWQVYTLHGLQLLDLYEPVCHLSGYEAAAYAAWAGARLPTEFEWEAAAASVDPATQRYDPLAPHPQPLDHAAAAASGAGLQQLYGEVWEWTASAYAPYPGFKPWPGPAAEYNGKFMVNQLVLRGGSCATPPDHLRASYRNFFPPAARWQFSGVRLARDAT